MASEPWLPCLGARASRPLPTRPGGDPWQPETLTPPAHVHDIAPDPALLLCFPIEIHCINCIYLDVACDAFSGMFPMAESTKNTTLYALSPAGKSQQRYTVAALVY